MTLTSIAPNVPTRPAAMRSACLAGTPSARNDRALTLSRRVLLDGCPIGSIVRIGMAGYVVCVTKVVSE